MTNRAIAVRACVALSVLASLCLAGDGDASQATAAPLLPPGPHAVGFRSTWIVDEGRRYRTAFDDGATYGAEPSPRPVLVLAWYPARAGDAEASMPDAAPPMEHRGYFDIASDDPRLAPLAAAVAAHARGIVAEEVLGAPESALDEAQSAELERVLATPTTCHRDAAPAPGPFPLVVYHSGAGSSFEDNAALCEFLASHGCVVLGSAFLRADGSDLGIDAGRGSAEDAQCLVRWARTQPFIDADHVAFVGHSAGAQAFLKAAAQPDCVADALVLLDTTQDYYSLSLPLHESLVREATEGVANLVQPLLVVASPDAVFALCDSLVHAERWYLTVPELGHDEYIAQGLQRLERIGWHAASGSAASGTAASAPAPSGVADDDAAEIARTPAVRATYRALGEIVLAFLDAQLRGDAAAFAARLELDRARPWTHTAPCLVAVPRGVRDPAPWDPDGAAPPTPRQFARLMVERGAEDACAVLARFRDTQPRGPLYTSTMLAGSLLHELDAEGRTDEARLYYAALQEIPLQALSLFEFLAEISGMQGRPEQARHFLRLACTLDPEDADLAARLRALEETPGK